MELRHLTHLVALADECNFRRAAERVHLSQPAFSRSIQAAELEWGLQLFDRSGPRVRCTPAGNFVLEKARRVLQDWRSLERDVALYRDRQIGDLAFGIGPFPAAALLDDLLLELRRRFPGVQVRVQVNSASHLLAYVRNETHDFFVGDLRYVRNDDAFDVIGIGRLPGAFYVRGGHPLLAPGRVKVAQLVPYGLATGVLPDEVTTFLLRLMGRTPREGLPVVLECDDANALKAIALSTDTVLVATPALVRHEVAAGRLYALAPADLPASHAELGVASLRGRSFSPVASYAVEFLKQLAAAH